MQGFHSRQDGQDGKQHLRMVMCTILSNVKKKGGGWVGGGVLTKTIERKQCARQARILLRIANISCELL